MTSFKWPVSGAGGGSSGITTLTGDVGASGTGSVVATIQPGAVTDTKLGNNLNATHIADGSVSNTEFQRLDGVTGNIQTQLDAKLPLAGGTLTGSLVLAADATADLQPATFSQLNHANSYKTSVYCATTASITLSGLQTIDGVGSAAGLRVLVKNQGAANGIYIMSAGAWPRAKDADTAASLTMATVFVQTGLTNSQREYQQINQVTTVGVTNQIWTICGGVNNPATNIADGSVSNVAFQRIAGLTSDAQTQVDGKQPLNADLTAIAAFAGTGFAVRTASNTWTQRQVTAGSSKVSVTNPAGVAGDVAVDVVEANLTLGNIGGTLGISKGGTGQTTKAPAFDALSPNTTLGDVTYHNGTNSVRLAGNTATTKKFFTQTGNGTVSAAPGWNTIALDDVPQATATQLGAVKGGTVPGYTGGSAIAAGNVGEVLSISRLRSNGLTLANNTTTNVCTTTSLTLTPGVWLITASVGLKSGTTTNFTDIEVGVSKTSATLPVGDTCAVPTSGEYKWGLAIPNTPASSNDLIFPSQSYVANVSTNTTLFLVAFALWTTSSPTCFGSLHAVRIA